MEIEHIQFVVSEEHAGERLDKFVPDYNEDWSRTRVQEWAQEMRICVNGKNKKGSYRVKANDVVTVNVPPIAESHLEAEEIPLDIRYEDQDVLVVNKPRGMVVHPGSGNHSGTLVNALLSHCRGELSGIGGVTRPGIVHRIDKDTSGLLMVAKNDVTHQGLSEQLKEHTVDREYVALVHGVILHDTGTIEAPIGRDPNHRQQMAVIEGGKKAVTHFTVKQRYKEHTIVVCRLETGRTHQIRVHMKYIGYPIIGDPTYGLKNVYSIQGQALHAQVLGFTHPRTGKRIQLEAEMPVDMVELMNHIK